LRGPLNALLVIWRKVRDDLRTQFALQQEELHQAVAHARVLHRLVPPDAGVRHKLELDLEDPRECSARLHLVPKIERVLVLGHDLLAFSSLGVCRVLLHVPSRACAALSLIFSS
jgi:hypothetical protein